MLIKIEMNDKVISLEFNDANLKLDSEKVKSTIEKKHKCKCGSTVTNSQHIISRHERTNKHIAYMVNCLEI